MFFETQLLKDSKACPLDKSATTNSFPKASSHLVNPGVTDPQPKLLGTEQIWRAPSLGYTQMQRLILTNSAVLRTISKKRIDKNHREHVLRDFICILRACDYSSHITVAVLHSSSRHTRQKDSQSKCSTHIHTGLPGQS